MERKTLAEGISLTTLGDGRYVCNRISVNLCFPRSEEASAQGAMLSYLLRRGSERYPGFAPLNRKLYDLYGAYYDCTLATPVSYTHLLSTPPLTGPPCLPARPRRSSR